MKIVFLDADSIGRDIDLSGLEKIGTLTVYGSTRDEEIPERVAEADVIVTNKKEINEKSVGQAKNLKLVCLTGTGINNLDTDYLDSRGIAWRNVVNYSTEDVAQHTFAMLFYLLEHLAYYDGYVKSGKYVNDFGFSHYSTTFHELHGMTWGIIGMGNIGRRVAEIASCFGCRVIYYSTSGKNTQAGFERVTFEELLDNSDIVSVHAPLNENTRGLMDKSAFSRMKKSSIFINVGRGAIMDEQDLADALKNGEIAAAGIDVLDREPMAPDCPLLEIKDSTKLLLTPHIAWAPVEARQRVITMVIQNIRDYYNM